MYNGNGIIQRGALSISIPSTTLEKFTNFGDLLRFLRRRVSLTQMELANAVGYSHTQISRLEQNLRLPDIPTLESNFVYALGLEEERRAVARLLELAANVRREDAPAPGLSPYKGLNYYEEADAELFVGREALTAQLVESILALTSNNESREERFFAIVGASGSGKSSLVRAGVVPALRWNKTSNDWHIRVLTPTEHPLESLAAALTPDGQPAVETEALIDELAQDSRTLQHFATRNLGFRRGARLMLVVDQFEELFALCRSDEEKASFIENLLSAALQADGLVLVLITLRADFYAHCAGYPQLRDALARHQKYIGAMTDEELRRAIEESAQRGRWEFEPGLVDLLMHDVGHEPGALPLLSHALLETWQRRRGRTMTLSGYASSRGVRGAIAETAETVYTDQFTREQQAIARRIFLRLTELSDETTTADTRRRARLDELVLKPEEADSTQVVLKALADARLITTSEDSVEVAHEALIREWPTLRGWLEDNRAGLRLHRQLTETAQEWLEMERSPDILYRGTRLAQTREWAAAHEDEMNMLEREFLSKATEASEREAEEREAQRQRELEAAHKLVETERRAANQLRRRALFLAGAFALALILAGFALFFQDRAKQNAMTATSRELAAAAISNLDEDPERSMLLALQAESTAHTTEAENALHRSILASRVQLVLRHDAEVWTVTFSPDGKHIATASQDGMGRIWDANTGKLLITLVGHTESMNGIVYSPDGKRLATTSDDHTAKVWDAATGKELLTLAGHANVVKRIAFSPDGNQLVTTSVDGTAKVWNALTGEELLTFSGYTDQVLDVAFDPNGKRVATTSGDSAVRIWDPSSGKELLVLPFIETKWINAVAFSQDGVHIIATGGGISKVWDATSGEVLFSGNLGHTRKPLDIALSPDGRLGATGGEDQKAKVWDSVTGQVLFTLSGHSQPINSVTFSPDGTRLATAGYDSTVRIWNITPATEALFIPFADSIASGWSGQLSYSPDGKRILSDYTDPNARIWDAASGKELIQFSDYKTYAVNTSYSSDGRWVAAANDDNTIIIWNAKTGKQQTTLIGHQDFVSETSFSPDEKHLASASYDGTILIWDLAEASVLFTLQGPSAGLAGTAHSLSGFDSVAYSPDGKHVVSGDRDGNGAIWDASTGQKTFDLPGPQGNISAVAYSPDGMFVALAGATGDITVWNALNGQKVLNFTGHNVYVSAIQFSPSGKWIATASGDGTVRVWDAVTGENLLNLPVDSRGAGGVSFSPDGRRLAVGGASGIYVFVLPIDEVIGLAKSRLSRALTLEECQQYLHMEQCPSKP